MSQAGLPNSLGRRTRIDYPLPKAKKKKKKYKIQNKSWVVTKKMYKIQLKVEKSQSFHN